jgi:hypothetical protein
MSGCSGKTLDERCRERQNATLSTLLWTDCPAGLGARTPPNGSDPRLQRENGSGTALAVNFAERVALIILTGMLPMLLKGATRGFTAFLTVLTASSSSYVNENPLEKLSGAACLFTGQSSTFVDGIQCTAQSGIRSTASESRRSEGSHDIVLSRQPILLECACSCSSCRHRSCKQPLHVRAIL